ncbi:MAG: toxic anion resistance protein [Oscillospiraceae bacterium]|nr:toxic anion resistance protein [Oscillospiraceae bacterium]
MDENIPQLTLTPDLGETPALEVPQPAPLAEPKKPAPEAGPDMSMLTEAEQKAVKDFAEKIDLKDSNQILQYGVAAQKNISDFSESALSSVRTKDMGEIGDMVGSLLIELKGFDAEEEKKGLFGLFKKVSKSIEVMKIKYDKAEANVDKIAQQLEKHQITLMKDIAVLDQMYAKNLEYYKQLTMYILAGQQKLAKERATTLPALQQKARETGAAEDAQAANDYQALCNRFEKKLHDLELTRVISVQMAPQIRMIQNNDTLMTEKIQTTIINTIPLWKSQMVLALGTHHSQQAIEAERQVTDMTNELLRKNADKLKMATIETAKAAERSVVDIETLQHTNESLISTLDEVLQIQTDGAKKRREAEVQLRRIEGELKQKLLEVRG